MSLSDLQSLRPRWLSRESGLGPSIIQALGTEEDEFGVLWGMVDRIRELEAQVRQWRAYADAAYGAMGSITEANSEAVRRTLAARYLYRALSQQPQELGVASLASERPQPEGGVGVKPSEGER